MNNQIHTRLKLASRIVKLINYWSISLKINAWLKRRDVKKNLKMVTSFLSQKIGQLGLTLH